MARQPASPADRTLIEAARAQGVTVTATQLERWRRVGLLPANARRHLGRGRGSTSEPAPGVAELAVWLGRHMRRGQRTHDVALRAFGDGLAVPQHTVRAAFRDAAQLPPAENMSGRPGAVLVPRRMRRIDARVAAVGMSPAPPELARFDRGPTHDEPLSPAGLSLMATAVALDGSELTGTEMADVIRSTAPEGTAVPGASMLEYPDGIEATEVGDETGRTLLPTGPMQETLWRVVNESSLERLRAGWISATDRRAWALGLCAAVEAELDDGVPGAAVAQWRMAAAGLGPGRLEIRAVLQDKHTPSGAALTAVILLWQAQQLLWLQELLPDGLYELLPVLLPPYLLRLLELLAVSGPDG
ncbi:hypothetical protein [Actinoplanes sp. URMC 104]|uniref:hypothetical protein n=1 Tax=Actinoplanes sp. URMC 104 TaxID=3423409 RepID=UPI003F1BAEC5